MKQESNNFKISAAILAGGDARRLGKIAKGNIELGNGKTIIQQLIKEIGKAGISNVVIVANDLESYRNCGVKVILDIRAGIGPMGGIEAGLSYFASRSDAVMLVPCDMPNITAKEMLVLKEAFIETKEPVVFAETTGFFWHPLCAVVHNDVRQMVSSAIDKGQRKIRDVWKEVKAASVPFGNETAFFNINSLDDMNRWLRSSKNEKANLC